MVSERGFNSVKGQGMINYGIKQILPFILNSDIRPEYDFNFERGQILTDIGCNTFVAYNKFKKIVVVSSRDMVLLSNLRSFPDGTMVVSAQSVEWPDMPE